MSTEQTVVIKDACILIDLFDLELLHAFYQLDVTPVTTGFVIGEILDAQQAAAIEQLVANGRLTIYNDGDIDVINGLTEALPALSFADCSVLELSERVPGLILSADKSLRNEAKRRKLIVKGLLWVINQLFEKGLMSKVDCLAKLDAYPQVNPRAPRNDIQLLRDKLNKL